MSIAIFSAFFTFSYASINSHNLMWRDDTTERKQSSVSKLKTEEPKSVKVNNKKSDSQTSQPAIVYNNMPSLHWKIKV